MGRVATLQQQARERARRRRIALDHDRTARDERVESAAAQAILALGERDDALGRVRAAEGRIGDAVRRIIDEGVNVDGVARLCDVSAGEVRRLRRAAEAARDPSSTAYPAGLDPHLPGGARQVLDDLQVRHRAIHPAPPAPRQQAATGRPG